MRREGIYINGAECWNSRVGYIVIIISTAQSLFFLQVLCVVLVLNMRNYLQGSTLLQLSIVHLKILYFSKTHLLLFLQLYLDPEISMKIFVYISFYPCVVTVIYLHKCTWKKESDNFQFHSGGPQQSHTLSTSF